jgi:hypothetical protein
MPGPIILPLDDAVSAVAAASFHSQVTSGVPNAPLQTHFHVFNAVTTSTGDLVMGHSSHASHASHASHVSSVGGGGYTPPVYTPPVYTPPVHHHAPTAPTNLRVVSGDGSATISWDAAHTDDGHSITYVVTAYPGAIKTTVVGDTYVTIDGLQNGVAYRFTVVASNSIGHGPATGLTSPVKPLEAQVQVQLPLITGQAAVHQKLKVKTPGWETGTTFTYQWKANGIPIDGATHRSFKIPYGLVGKRIDVTVTGENPLAAKGASATSARTHKVALATTPKISGSLIAGSAVHVVPGKWTKGTTLTYTWYVGEKRIKNDPGPGLVLKKKYVGKSVRVRVTGSKQGYGKVTLKSVPSAHVRS